MARASGVDAAGRKDTELEESILAYLERHPEAADTVQGIVNWWLPRQRYETACWRVEKALGVLVERGELRTAALPNGAALYALNKTTRPPRKH